MNSAALKIFREVAEAGSIQAAAKRLHCVPSNVTTRLKELEQSLGVALFSRDRRRLNITAEGLVLLDYAKQMQQLLDDAESAVKAHDPAGKLRLVSMETTAAVRLPAILAAFHRCYPQVQLELTTTTTERALHMVQAGEADIGFVAENPALQPLPLSSSTVCSETLVLVAPHDVPFPLTPEDCRQLSMLSFKSGCNYRLRFQQWLEHQGLGAMTVQEFGSFQAILGCVSAGMGLAMLPRSVVEPYYDQFALKLHDIDCGNVATQMIWLESRTVSRTVQAFLDHVTTDR